MLDISLVSAAVFSLKTSEEKLIPAIANRILDEQLGFYDKVIPLEKISSGVYIMDFYKLCDRFPLYTACTYDLVMYSQDDDQVRFVSVEEDISLADMFGKITYKNFELEYKMFKAANGKVFIKIRMLPIVGFEISSIVEKDDKFELYIKSEITENVSVSLKRRSHSSHNREYNTSLELNYTKADGYLVADFYKDSIGVFSQAAGEIWDFTVDYDGKVYDCKARDSFLSEYFRINDLFSAKLFVSDKCFASLWVKEDTKKDNNKVKVAIIGSCFSKEAFHSVNYCNPDYKRYYENGFICWHQSFIALMSPPLEYDKSKIDDEKMRRECDVYAEEAFLKTTLQKLKDYKPDYLIIDTYTEAYASVFEDLEGRFITDAFYLMNTSALREMKIKSKVHPSRERRFELFKDAFNRFLKEINGIIPNDRIVLVRTHPSTHKMANGKLVLWEDHVATEYQTAIWNKNDDYIVSAVPGIRIIDMRFGNYYSDASEHLTMSRNHLNSGYYKDLLNSFNKIVLYDMIKKQNPKELLD